MMKQPYLEDRVCHGIPPSTTGRCKQSRHSKRNEYRDSRSAIRDIARWLDVISSGVRKTTYLLACTLAVVLSGCKDQSTVTNVEQAGARDFSNQLDLEVVISVFGESKDMEDFERRLNDPSRMISNLDLNEDGMVDYLRVVESTKNDAHLVNVQAVVGPDQYQDVASFGIVPTSQGQAQVQVVGDPYIYGQNYAIQPTF